MGWMRISLLMQREPFGQVLEKTLATFLSNQRGCPVQVIWHNTRFYSRTTDKSQLWLCNPYLNAIFVAGVRKEAVLPIILEYSRSTVWWKRFFQKCYVVLALSPALSRCFADYRVEIAPPLKNPESVLILGGNHHLRFHDYRAGKAFVIGKAGFNTRLMQNELAIRSAHAYLPTPHVLETGADGSWYSEPLIAGTPLNRLKNAAQGVEVLERICTGLFRLYRNTVKWISVADYTEELIQEIQNRVRKCHFLDDKAVNDITTLAAAIKTYVMGLRVADPDNPIAVVQTHGDFQPANILISANTQWLIDWEYTARRQAAYDLLVLATGSRAAGFSLRIRRFLTSGSMLWETGFRKCPFLEWQDAVWRCRSVAIFLLEELVLKLLQNANPLFQLSGPGFAGFLQEIRQSLDALEDAQLPAL